MHLGSVLSHSRMFLLQFWSAANQVVRKTAETIILTCSSLTFATFQEVSRPSKQGFHCFSVCTFGCQGLSRWHGHCSGLLFCITDSARRPSSPYSRFKPASRLAKCFTWSNSLHFFLQQRKAKGLWQDCWCYYAQGLFHCYRHHPFSNCQSQSILAFRTSNFNLPFPSRSTPSPSPSPFHSHSSYP